MLQYITCIATAGILPYHTQKPLYSSYVTDLFAHLAHVANTFSWHTILKKLAHLGQLSFLPCVWNWHSWATCVARQSHCSSMH